MRNKFKVAALVVAVVVGMVLYKEDFERKEAAREAEEKKDRRAGRARKR
jgi:hypothetical protein